LKPTVDALFRVLGEAEVYGKVVYLRTLTEIQNEERVNHALKAARVMRRRLRTDEEFRAEKLDETACATRAELEKIALDLHRVRSERAAVSEVVSLDHPEPPDDATITDVIDTMDENDDIERDVEDARKKWVDERVDAFKLEVQGWDDAKLREFVEEETVAGLCNREFNVAFDRATVALCCYESESRKKLMFSSIGDVMQVGDKFRSTVSEAYRKLDSFSGDSESLKN
jgi:hypothetical protein